MGLFNSLKKTATTIKKREETLELPQGFDRNDPVWSLRTINDIIIAMCSRMTRKSSYGENMEALSEEERVFYVTTEIDSQVSSLGFDHFFFDEAGRFAMEAPQALETIGAVKRAEVAKEAIAVVGGSLPENNKERALFIRNELTDEMRKELNELTEKYVAIEDDFNRLIYKYLSEYHFKFTE